MLGNRGGGRDCIPITHGAGLLKVEVKGTNVTWVLPNGTIRTNQTILNEIVTAGTTYCFVNSLIEYGYFKIYEETTSFIYSLDLKSFQGKLKDTFSAYIIPTTNLTLTGDLKDLGGRGNILYTSNASKLTGGLSDLSQTLTQLRLQGGAQIKGNLSSISNMSLTTAWFTGCSSLEGALSSIPKTVTWLSLMNCPKVEGSLADLKTITNNSIVYEIYMDYCTKILGSLADLGGKVTRTLSLRDCGNITGKLSDLQGKLTYRLSLGRSTGNWTNVTGDLSDLQSKLTCYLDLSGCVEITGDISSLGNKITDVVNLASCSKITGNIASLSNVGTTLNLYNCPLVYGDLASLSNTTTQKSKITNMIILNTSGITGVFKANSLTKYIYLYGTGQSPSEVDATLIALDNVTPMGASGRVISVNNRTSTSDGAVASLKSKNWQVKVNGTTV